jgi:hypothetical protein
MASAAFAIDGTAVPKSDGKAVEVEYGDTVNLALASTVGAETIEWSILGTNSPNVSTPSVTRAGTPLGATASFTVGTDSGTGFGICYGVRCKVTDGGGTVTYGYGVVGVPAAYGEPPHVDNEELWRHATHGWLPKQQRMAMGYPHTTWNATTTGSDEATAATVNIRPGTVMRIASVWSGYDATSGDRLYRESSAVFENAAGVVAQLGSDSDANYTRGDATWSATFSASTGSDVYIKYSGDATNSTTWRGFVYTMRLGN